MNQYVYVSFTRPGEQGSILIIVLWFSAGLVTVALLFGHGMYMQYRAADNVLAGYQSQQAIEGASRYILHVLKNMDEPGQVPDEDDFTAEWIPVGDSLVWFLGRNTEEVQTLYPIFNLVDENAKLNINTATVEMLESLPNMTAQLAASIVDWRDEDSDITENGAESESYLLRQPGYECKNGPFETVYEMRLLMGAWDELLFGEDSNFNGLLDGNENDGNKSLPLDDQNGSLQAGILEYVTVLSREKNQRSEGTDPINIGEGANDELQQLLQEKFGEERADEIQQRIQGQNNYDSLLQLYIQSEMKPEEFSQIESELSVSDDAVLEGRINVNTACAEVLACLPGMDSSKANQLVSYRQSHSNDLDSIAWVADALDEETALEIGPYLTSKSYQFTADIIAVSRFGKGYRRTQFIIDTSEDEPVIRYRRDLSGLGWALGKDIRRQLTALKEETL